MGLEVLTTPKGQHFYLDVFKDSDREVLRDMIDRNLDYGYFNGQTSVQASYQYVKKALVANKIGPLLRTGNILYAIRLPENDRFIGTIILYPNIFPNPFKRSDAEIGFFIDPEFQNRGIAQTAAKEIIKHAVHKGWLKSLYATVHPDNEASKCVLEKLGLEVVAWMSASKYQTADGKNFEERFYLEATPDVVGKMFSPSKQSVAPSPS